MNDEPTLQPDTADGESLWMLSAWILLAMTNMVLIAVAFLQTTG